MSESGKRLCDENCNECPLIAHKNSRMITHVLNVLFKKFGEDVYELVQGHCPNLTVCYDCRVDDFVHLEGCELAEEEE